MRKKIRIAAVAVIGVLAIAGWSWGTQAAESKAEPRVVARTVTHDDTQTRGDRYRNRAVATETRVITVTETVIVVVDRVRVGSNLRHRWMANGMLKLFSEDVYETRPVTVRSTVSTPSPINALVNLNTATVEELDAKLDGIGPVMARRIVAARPFHSIEDLANISGIGPRRMAAIKPFVTVN